MTAYAFPLSAGATPVAAGRTQFRFWAPAQRAPQLVIEGREPMVMTATGDGWFACEAACGAGTRYRYRLDDGLDVPDPASRAQAGDVHGASVVVDPNAYRWRCADWCGRPWTESVIYELHPGLLGGFAGIADRLAALAELGVTVVELMPIGAFPGRRNWGYDGVLPYAPDAGYGSPEALKALVDRAHALGLSIMLDVVYNHFGPDGNYLAHYAPAFFRDDLQTPWGGAIDFRQPEVRRYFTENALYWLMEYRFDGLRFDAVHAIAERDWLFEMGRTLRETVEPGRHVHLVLENEHNDAGLLQGPFDAQWNDDVHHCLHVMLTGEGHGYYGGFVDDTAGKLARALREGFVYQGECPPGGVPRGSPSAHLPPAAFVDCLQNHDQVGNRALGERLSVLADPQLLRAAVGLLLLSPHIPLIFMGEETGAREPFLFFTDLHPGLAPLVRDGRRREFAAFPGFSDPLERERIPDPNAPTTFERSRAPVAGEGGDPAVIRLYRELLALRREQIVPRLSGACALDAEVLGPKAVRAAWRLGDGARLTLMSNLDRFAVEIPATPPGVVLWATGQGVLEGALAGGSTLLWIEEAV